MDIEHFLEAQSAIADIETDMKAMATQREKRTLTREAARVKGRKQSKALVARIKELEKKVLKTFGLWSNILTIILIFKKKY